jgi:hypothetical protein
MRPTGPRLGSVRRSAERGSSTETPRTLASLRSTSERGGFSLASQYAGFEAESVRRLVAILSDEAAAC